MSKAAEEVLSFLLAGVKQKARSTSSHLGQHQNDPYSLRQSDVASCPQPSKLARAPGMELGDTAEILVQETGQSRKWC